MTGTSSPKQPSSPGKLNYESGTDIRIDGVESLSLSLFTTQPTTNRFTDSDGHPLLIPTISQYDPLISPLLLRSELPLSPNSQSIVSKARQACANVISGDDHRIIVVVGPCSIHGLSFQSFTSNFQTIRPLSKEKITSISKKYIIIINQLIVVVF